MSDFLSDMMFSKYRDFIYNASGISFSESNRSILESRLKERLRALKLEKVESFYELLVKDESETKTFLDSITTNLTRFFRNQAHYDTFINFVIPEIVKYKENYGEKKLTVWSAGCSTGEECYTNAMVLARMLPKDFDFKIIGSDLSLKSLMKAQDGFYLDSQVRQVPEDYLNEFFIKEDGGYRVKSELKKHVQFEYHNLKFEGSFRNIDIIFCRNVLIYFDEAAQKSVIEQFWKLMNNPGYLFIGHSESLFGMNTQFEFIKTDWACVYGKTKN